MARFWVQNFQSAKRLDINPQWHRHFSCVHSQEYDANAFRCAQGFCASQCLA